MNELKEKPFEYLRRKENNNYFEREIVDGWYLARAYVLKRLRDNNVYFKPDSDEHLHVILDGDSAPMLFIARQIALTTHYINFNEDACDETHRNRTIISLVSNNPDIKRELEKEEYLCNLPKYCKFVDINMNCENADSYIDIEIHIVREVSEEYKHTLVFRKNEVEKFFEKAKDDDSFLCIDTRKAIYAGRMYDIGTIIQNLPAEDIHCTKRYSFALDVFQHEKLKEKLIKMVDDTQWKKLSLSQIKEKLSCIMCADCFFMRKGCVELCGKDKMNVWEKYNEFLSKSEHARWVVEKLIMGYRPLNAKERFYDESLHVQFNSKEQKEKFHNRIKRNDNDPAHIDICTYKHLRRINPDDLKYDSFLMLAIPKILKKINEYN